MATRDKKNTRMIPSNSIYSYRSIMMVSIFVCMILCLILCSESNGVLAIKPTKTHRIHKLQPYSVHDYKVDSFKQSENIFSQNSLNHYAAKYSGYQAMLTDAFASIHDGWQLNFQIQSNSYDIPYTYPIYMIIRPLGSDTEASVPHQIESMAQCQIDADFPKDNVRMGEWKSYSGAPYSRDESLEKRYLEFSDPSSVFWNHPIDLCLFIPQNPYSVKDVTYKSVWLGRFNIPHDCVFGVKNDMTCNKPDNIELLNYSNRNSNAQYIHTSSLNNIPILNVSKRSGRGIIDAPLLNIHLSTTLSQYEDNLKHLLISFQPLEDNVTDLKCQKGPIQSTSIGWSSLRIEPNHPYQRMFENSEAEKEKLINDIFYQENDVSYISSIPDSKVQISNKEYVKKIPNHAVVCAHLGESDYEPFPISAVYLDDHNYISSNISSESVDWLKDFIQNGDAYDPWIVGGFTTLGLCLCALTYRWVKKNPIGHLNPSPFFAKLCCSGTVPSNRNRVEQNVEFNRDIIQEIEPNYSHGISRSNSITKSQLIYDQLWDGAYIPNTQASSFNYSTGSWKR